MACPDSFLPCREENDPDPESVRYLDPDKLVCFTSCREDVTNPSFLHTFLWFSSQISLLQPTLES